VIAPRATGAILGAVLFERVKFIRPEELALEH
jgi:hypothetical protein